jgi:hypothetical protein
MCRKAIKNSFVFTDQHKEAIREALERQGVTCLIVNGEVDLALSPSDTVISADSDFWIHYEKVLVLRKARGSLQLDVYSREDALCALDLSLIGFQVLAIVSGNDYAPNIYGFGVGTNYKII